MARVYVMLRYQSGVEYREGLSVSKVCAQITGSQAHPNELVAIELQDMDSQARVYITLQPEAAIPLARAMLNVAEGYASESESEVA